MPRTATLIEDTAPRRRLCSSPTRSCSSFSSTYRHTRSAARRSSPHTPRPAAVDCPGPAPAPEPPGRVRAAVRTGRGSLNRSCSPCRPLTAPPSQAGSDGFRSSRAAGALEDAAAVARAAGDASLGRLVSGELEAATYALFCLLLASAVHVGPMLTPHCSCDACTRHPLLLAAAAHVRCPHLSEHPRAL